MATAIIELKARTKRLEEGMRRAERSTRRVGKTADATTVKVQGLSRAGRLLGTAFAGLGFAFVARSIVNIGKEFEILTARLATFEGSTAAAGMALENLNKVAQSTPFQLQDVINSFIQLRSAGLQPTNRELVALGNVAAAFGQTMNQVANVVFRGASSTELFYNLGITARKEGDKLRVTYDGVTKTIEATNKGIQDYLVSLGETRFAGAAVEQAKGLTAAFSNLSGNLQFTIDKLGNASGLFQRISVVLNSLSGDIINLGENAEDIFGGVFDTKDLIAFEFRVAKIRIQIASFYDDIVGIFDDNALAQTLLGGFLFGKAGVGVAFAANFDIPGLRSSIQEALDTDAFTANIIAEIIETALPVGLLKALELAPILANNLFTIANTKALDRLTAATLLGGKGGKGGVVTTGGGKGGNAGKAATGLSRLVTVLGRVGVAGTVLGGLALLAYASSEAWSLWNKVNDSVDKRIAERAAAPEGAADVDDLIDINDKTLATLREQLRIEVTANGNSDRAYEILKEIKDTEADGQALLIRLIEALLRSDLLDTRPGLREKGKELGVVGAAAGGYISGPGTGTSDSIPALLSDGEYVIRASQAKKFGGLLESINNGTQGFAAGGYVNKYQTGGAVTGAGSGFFEGTLLDEFTKEQVELLRNLQEELVLRRQNRDELVALLATQEEGTAAYKATKAEIDKTNRALAQTEQQMADLADTTIDVTDAINAGFFDEKQIKSISGELSSGIAAILSGNSNESIGSVFKKAARNYLQKQLEETLNTVFTSIFDSVNKAIDGQDLGSGGLLGSIFGSFFSGAPGFNKGGVVPGIGNTDTVPALLTPGETIIPKGQSGGTNIYVTNNISAPLGVDENVSRFIAEETERTIAQNPNLVNSANNTQNRRNRTFGGR